MSQNRGGRNYGRNQSIGQGNHSHQTAHVGVITLAPEAPTTRAYKPRNGNVVHTSKSYAQYDKPCSTVVEAKSQQTRYQGYNNYDHRNDTVTAKTSYKRNGEWKSNQVVSTSQSQSVRPNSNRGNGFQSGADVARCHGFDSFDPPSNTTYSQYSNTLAKRDGVSSVSQRTDYYDNYTETRSQMVSQVGDELRIDQRISYRPRYD